MTPEQFAELVQAYGNAVLNMAWENESVKKKKAAMGRADAAKALVLDAYAQAVAERDELKRDCDDAMRSAQEWRIKYAQARAGGAVKVPDEPDAWLFRGKGDGEGAAFATVCPPDECTQHYPLERWTRGYSFTPLYAHPPAEAATDEQIRAQFWEWWKGRDGTYVDCYLAGYRAALSGRKEGM